ncbi:MAG: pilus assembly protein PilP, partial [Pseudohongiellaceae bacterium]
RVLTATRAAMNRALSHAKLLAATVLILLLAACDRSSDMGELQQFVEESINRDPGPIEPLPEFISYEPFTYSAASMRSPFESPEEANRRSQRQDVSQVQPDMDRPREPLEAFPLSSLSLVGSLSRDNVRWALVRDGDGDVQRVTEGNYLGRNHGRVITVREASIELMEIVPSGDGGWIERPQTLALEGQASRTNENGNSFAADTDDGQE